MINTISNKYFLRALEAYPYDLSEVIESLDYTLSYDPEHVGAHCLMGQLNMEQLKQYDKAEYHFDQALMIDVNYTVTYEHYSLLSIFRKDFDKASRIINYALKIPAINRALMRHREALICEHLGKLAEAKKLMRRAYQEACNEEDRNFIKPELERIKTKLDASGKKSSGKKSKKRSSKK